jgi:hypothetical protein
MSGKWFVYQIKPLFVSPTHHSKLTSQIGDYESKHKESSK